MSPVNTIPYRTGVDLKRRSGEAPLQATFSTPGTACGALLDLVGLRGLEPVLGLRACLFTGSAVFRRVTAPNNMRVRVVILATVAKVKRKFRLGATNLYVGLGFVLHKHPWKADAGIELIMASALPVDLSALNADGL